MGTYGEIYIRLNDKNLSLENDLNLFCSKTAQKVAWDLRFYSFIKQTYFMDSFLGQTEITLPRHYIHELDIKEWSEGFDEPYGWGLGVIAGLSRLQGARIFFRNEYCDCTGYYGIDESEKWALEKKAVEFSPNE